MLEQNNYKLIDERKKNRVDFYALEKKDFFLFIDENSCVRLCQKIDEDVHLCRFEDKEANAYCLEDCSLIHIEKFEQVEFIDVEIIIRDKKR